jgi:hypothetical protein
MTPGKRTIARMLAYLGKRLTWIIMSGVVLVIGVGAAILNNSASADTVTDNLPLLHHHHSPPPAVPEVNTGLVLLPIVLAILLFTSRRFLRRGLENQ